MEYKGPKLKLKDKPFSKNLEAKGGFVKATYFKIQMVILLFLK